MLCFSWEIVSRDFLVNPETLSESTEMLLKVITLQRYIRDAAVLSRNSENRSKEAEKPQYQHTQQKCFPQFTAPRFFIWPHSEDKMRMQFQFGLCNRGWAKVLVQRKTHSSPISTLTCTLIQKTHAFTLVLCIYAAALTSFIRAFRVWIYSTVFGNAKQCSRTTQDSNPITAAITLLHPN